MRGAKAVDNGRLQVDLRDLPAGVKTTLAARAAERGVSMSGYLRAIIVEHAFMDHQAACSPSSIAAYEPLV